MNVDHCPADQWPDAELEHLGRCPVCDGTARGLRFEGLTDKAFGCAPGEWSMYDCATCGVAYLDPRPDAASIGRAYERYYTHDDGNLGEARYFWRASGLKSRLKMGYLNREYSYRFPRGIPFGHALVKRRGCLRRLIDQSIRHLPAPRAPGAKLLDVGCGNGSFLQVAAALGFTAVGLDPDPRAVAAGREHGLDIRSGLLPDPTFIDSGFEHVTFSHVLEHLHQPREALRQVFDLLAPGGRVWLSQPNLGALGLKRFGIDWRGLETPRHLSLFDRCSLTRLLEGLGFTSIHQLPSDEPAEFYYRQSLAMRAGLDPYLAPDLANWADVRREAVAANRAARRNPELAESFTMTASKPC